MGADRPTETAPTSEPSAAAPHAVNPERIARWAEAAKHPNEDDFNNAKKVFGNL